MPRLRQHCCYSQPNEDEDDDNQLVDVAPWLTVGSCHHEFDEQLKVSLHIAVFKFSSFKALHTQMKIGFGFGQ
jgi:hypothetical protein